MREGQQTDAQRRQLRSKYRQVQLQTRALKGSMCDVENSKLVGELVQEVNVLDQHVTKTRDEAVASEACRDLAECIFLMTSHAVDSDEGPSVSAMLATLKSKYANQDVGEALQPVDLNWKRFGEDCSQMFRLAPGVSALFGALEVPSKKQIQRQRHEKQPLKEVTRADELEKIEDSEKQETDRNMEEMYRVLKDVGRAPMGELILNHHSFPQTVENMFSLSFLLRDNRVQITMDPEKGYLFTCLSKEQTAAATKSRLEQHQFVAHLSMNTWRQLTQSIHPHQCLMRHRDVQDRTQVSCGLQDITNTQHLVHTKEAILGKRVKCGERR